MDNPAVGEEVPVPNTLESYQTGLSDNKTLIIFPNHPYNPVCIGSSTGFTVNFSRKEILILKKHIDRLPWINE